MPNYLKDITINEISGVDRPAQEPAVTAIIKSASGTPEKVTKADRVDLVSTETNGHRHAVLVTILNGRLDFVVYYAGDPDRPYDFHDHQVVRVDGGFELILNEGHTHFVSDAEVEAVLGEVVANKNLEGVTLQSLVEKGITLQGKPIDLGDSEMTKEEKAAFDRLQSIVSLTTEEKAHFDTLSDADKDVFLNKSAEDRKSDIQKGDVTPKNDTDGDITEEGDTITFDGETVSKADNPVAFKALQEAKKSRDAREALELSKRADETLKGVSDDADVRNAIMKQIEGIEDEDMRGKAIKSLQTLAGISKVASTLSSSEESDQGEEIAKADGDGSDIPSVDELAEQVRKQNPDATEFECREWAHKKHEQLVKLKGVE